MINEFIAPENYREQNSDLPDVLSSSYNNTDASSRRRRLRPGRLVLTALTLLSLHQPVVRGESEDFLPSLAPGIILTVDTIVFSESAVSAGLVNHNENLVPDSLQPIDEEEGIYYLDTLEPADAGDINQAVNIPGVLIAEPNYQFTADDIITRPDETAETAGEMDASQPDDPYYLQQWNLNGTNGIGFAESWSSLPVTASVPITIAILDSGIDITHPDIDASRIVTGWDAIANIPVLFPPDEFGHGTMVAGIIMATQNNGTDITGIDGVSPIAIVKVMQASGVVNYSDILDGLVFARKIRARVINMSFAGWPIGGTVPAIDAEIERLHGEGAVLIAGSGNGAGTETGVGYPARHTHVMAVGSIDVNGLRSPTSSYGPELDIVAPGVHIPSTCAPIGVCFGSGTSFAAPHMTGIAGILLAKNPGLTPIEVTHALTSTASHRGGWDEQTGYGNVHLFGALYPNLLYMPVILN